MWLVGINCVFLQHNGDHHGITMPTSDAAAFHLREAEMATSTIWGGRIVCLRSFYEGRDAIALYVRVRGPDGCADGHVIVLVVDKGEVRVLHVRHLLVRAKDPAEERQQ